MPDQVRHQRVDHVQVQRHAFRFTPPGHEDRVGTFAPLSLWSDDVEASYETLRARGVQFDAPPKKEPWGSSVIFKDSEGNQLHLGSR